MLVLVVVLDLVSSALCPVS